MHSKKRLHVGRLLLVVAIAAILIAVIVFAINQLVGSVEVSSSDVSAPTQRTLVLTTTTTATTTAATTVPQPTVPTTVPPTQAVTTTTTKPPTQAPTTVPTTAAPTTHYVQSANVPWNLRLANDWNTLPANYESTITLECYSSSATREVDKFDSRAIQALRDMINAANRENAALRIRPVSCFRSAATQTRLFNNQVSSVKSRHPEYSQAQAEAVAATVVKRPGQSEHNTGLAADLGGSGNYSLNEDFADTAAYRWLIEHCADYGFILRFPKGKENITGVIYEPWHYRYVGVEHARYMMDNNLCLEEYLQLKGW